MVSCIIPAYNEEGRVGKVMSEALKVPEIDRIVVVDDGSSDRTWEEILSFNDPRIIRIRHRRNRGKTLSVRAAAERCRGRLVLLLDADISITAPMISRFLKAAMEYDMAVYYRETDEQAIQRLWRAIFMSQLLYSGIRVVRRDLLLNLRKGKYLIENELNRMSRGMRRAVYIGPYFHHYEKYKKMGLLMALFLQAKMITEIIHRIGLPEIIRQMVEFRVLLRHAIRGSIDNS